GRDRRLGRDQHGGVRDRRGRGRDLSAGTDPHRPGLCRVLVLRRRRPGLCPAPRRSDGAPAGGGATSRRTFPAPERQEEKEEAEGGDSLSRLPCLLVEG